MKKIEEYVRSIPDFPEPGIIFRDITSVLQDADGLQLAIAPLEEHTGGHRDDREDQGVKAENKDGSDQSGQQGDTHPLHDLLRGVRPGDVGRGGNDEFVAHYFFPPFFIMILARAMEGARGRLAGQTKVQEPQLKQ